MAGINQIQIKYVAVEDRLLLRVSTSDAVEFRFWLTRRFVRLMWPALGKALNSTPKIKTQASPQAKTELLAFEHQKAISESDFKTPFQEVTRDLPLGDAPTLLAKMQLRTKEDHTVVMALAPESGPGVDLSLNQELLHSLVELLANGAKIAAWDLDPVIETVASTSVPDDATVN